MAGWFLLRPASPENAGSQAISERPVASLERFVDQAPEGQSLKTNTRVVAISRDGRHLVYNTVEGLFLRPMNELEARLIPGTGPSANSPTFSPDGRELAYWDEARAQLMRIAISGGMAVPITDVPLHPYGMSWGTDGTILFSQPDGIWRVVANGGEPRRVIQVEVGQVNTPTFLPDGDTVLFSITDASDQGVGPIFAQSLSSGERTPILSGGNDVRYLPTGHLVYASGNTLFGVAFDVQELKVLGESAALVYDVDGQLFFLAAVSCPVPGTSTSPRPGLWSTSPSPPTGLKQRAGRSSGSIMKGTRKLSTSSVRATIVACEFLRMAHASRLRSLIGTTSTSGFGT